MGWKFRIGLVLAIFIGGVLISYFYFQPEHRLPIYRATDVDSKLVDQSYRNETGYHTIPDFALIDQNGQQVTPSNFENKIYVADFFFTTCKGICIDMASGYQRLQKEFQGDPQILLLSHSVTPVSDSVPVLKKYAIEKGAIDGKWFIVTGDKKEIYDLARKAYFAATSEGDGGPNDFVHTENFVLIDKEKRIRGFYEGTDSLQVNQLMADIRLLEKEYD